MDKLGRIFSLPSYGSRTDVIPFEVVEQTEKQLKVRRDNSTYLHRVRIADLNQREWFTSERAAASFMVSKLEREITATRDRMTYLEQRLSAALLTLATFELPQSVDAVDPVGEKVTG